MAEQLATFPMSKRTNYKWDDWLNGEIWKLHKGTDYDVASVSVVAAARAAAGRRKMRVRAIIEKDFVVLMAVSEKESS